MIENQLALVDFLRSYDPCLFYIFTCKIVRGLCMLELGQVRKIGQKTKNSRKGQKWSFQVNCEKL